MLLLIWSLWSVQGQADRATIPSDLVLPLRYEVPLAQEMVLRAELDKAEYEPGEPVRLLLYARNVTDHDVYCYCNLNEPASEIEYRRNGVGYRRLKLSPKQIFPHVSTLYRVRPGEEVRADVPMLLAFDYVSGTAPFDRAGAYELRIRYFDVGRQPESLLVLDSVPVSVVPASTGATDAYTTDMARLIQGGLGTMSPDAQRKGVAFLEQFPASVYAKYVKRAILGQLYGRMRFGTDDKDAALYERIKRINVAGEEKHE